MCHVSKKDVSYPQKMCHAPKSMTKCQDFLRKEPPPLQGINTKASPAKLHHQFPPQHISGTEDLSSEIELANYFPLCIPIPHLSSHSLYPSPTLLGSAITYHCPYPSTSSPNSTFSRAAAVYQVILEMVSTSMECCASPFFYLL